MRFGLHRFTVVAVLAIGVFPASARAIENIRIVNWPYTSQLSYGRERFRVEFLADLTERDVTRGVEVQLDLGSAGEDPRPLVKFFRVIPGLNAPLEEATFRIDFDLVCNAETGDVRFAYPECWISHPGRPNFLAYVDVVSRTTNILLQAPFQVGLRDENPASPGNRLMSEPFQCSPMDLSRSIGVYFDAEGTQCHGTIHPGTPGTVYVLAKGVSGEGIAGAQFRFAGMPDSWQAFPVPNPNVVALGDPFGAGVTMGFVCQQPQNDVVVLYSVLVLAGSEESNVRFTIAERWDMPSECPIAVNCDAPYFTSFCVADVPCIVNPTAGVTCGVITGVEPSSWTGVKSLFR